METKNCHSRFQSEVRVQELAQQGFEPLTPGSRMKGQKEGFSRCRKVAAKSESYRTRCHSWRPFPSPSGPIQPLPRQPSQLLLLPSSDRPFFGPRLRVKVVFLFLLGFFFLLRASTQIEVVCLSLSCAALLFEAEAEEESRQRPQLGARATSGKKKSWLGLLWRQRHLRVSLGRVEEEEEKIGEFRDKWMALAGFFRSVRLWFDIG